MREVIAALLKAKKGEPLTDREREIVSQCPVLLRSIHFDPVREAWVF